MRYQLVLARDDGLFSNLYSVLGALESCHDENCQVAVRFDTGPYLDPTRGPNWWEYYFERVSDVDPMTLPALDREDLLRQSRDWAYQGILRGPSTPIPIGRHVRVRPEVTEGLDAFWDDRLGDRFVVGMHLRGTDKFIEGLAIDLEQAFAFLEKMVQGRSANSWRVFVATDDASYLDEARKRLGDQVVCLDVRRSTSGQALHKEITREAWAQGPHRDEAFAPIARPDPYRLGLEALRDALLLGRCNVFIGTHSNMSYFVGQSNPSMPWISLGGMLPEAREQILAGMRRDAGGSTRPDKRAGKLRRLLRRRSLTPAVPPRG